MIVESNTVISLKEAGLTLGKGSDHQVEVLKGISLDIHEGETVGLLGTSGSGKTTTMMVMAGLESLDSGSIELAGFDITDMDEDSLATIRREHVGIIFQAFNLISSMTALENVMMPLEIAGRNDALERAKEALESVGLGERMKHLPTELSGGQQQRVSIARAIVGSPHIIFADEPTGNLDADTSDSIIKTLFKAADEANAALVLITHDGKLAKLCDSMVTIDAGVITSTKRGRGHAGLQ